MNRRNLESGYPERQAHDEQRRESEANAGSGHHRGEYRGGRSGGFGHSQNPQELEHRRPDWYRSDEYRGYGDDGQAGESRQGGRSGNGSGYESGHEGGPGGVARPIGGSRDSRQGYGQYREPTRTGANNPAFGQGDLYRGNNSDRSEQGYSEGRFAAGGFRSSDMHEGGSSPNFGESGQGASRYGARSAGYDVYGQRGHSQSQAGYGMRDANAGGFDQPNYGQAGSPSRGMNSEGPNRSGRTPKGYTRSDERIREDVNDRLMQANSLDPSEIEVQVENGEVKLIGSVETRQEKFLAEQLAEAVLGVKDIVNQLRVQRNTGGTQSNTQSVQKQSPGDGNLASATGNSTSNSRTSPPSGSSR